MSDFFVFKRNRYYRCIWVFFFLSTKFYFKSYFMSCQTFSFLCFDIFHQEACRTIIDPFYFPITFTSRYLKDKYTKMIIFKVKFLKCLLDQYISEIANSNNLVVV